MSTNDNGFITVEIQYRLGAFGFLASPEVKEHGQLNTGLLDQRFALEWVQEHIAKFGGDPTRVTIAGESSGAGSVMFHTLAYGGQNENLFNNVRSKVQLYHLRQLTGSRSSQPAPTPPLFTHSMTLYLLATLTNSPS